jgi:hypothetical protein
MASNSRTNRLPVGLRGVQYALLLAGEAAWLYAWSIGLGAWLGGSRSPVLALPLLLALLLVATVAARLTVTERNEARLIQVAFALAGLLGAALAGLVAIPLTEHWGRWTEVGDLLQKTEAGFRTAAAAGLALIVWWRGIVTARERPNLWHVEGDFRLGIFALAGVLVVAALVGPAAAPAVDSLILPTLVLVFVGLVGMPLARVVEEGEHPRHAGGPTLAPSGPWLGMLLGVVTGLLLVTLLLAQVFTFERIGALLEPLWGPLGTVFWALFYAIFLPLGFLVEGLIYLFRLIIRPGGEPPPPPQAPDTSWLDQLRNQERSNALPPELMLAVKVIVALALGAILVALLARAVFRFRDWWRGDDVEEVRELVWSWPGLAAIWRWLLARLRPRPPRIVVALFGRRVQGDTAAFGGSIRELYRQFLSLGAAIGRTRRLAETPFEYESRLNADGSLAGSGEVQSITESYVRVRYGPPAPSVPDQGPVAAALARLRALWQDRLSSQPKHPERS